MRRAFHLWAAGRGPARRLAPHVRLLTGFLLLSGTILADSTDIPSRLLLVGACLFWLVLVRLSWRTLLAVILYAIPVFVPMLVVVYLGQGLTPTAVWQVLGKGVIALLLGVATVASLSVSDFHRALARLPVPALAAAILVQIAHQAALLLEETQRLMAAVRLRAVAGRGAPAGPLVVTWLPRMLFKADRVAAAMDVRGFAQHVPGFHAASLRAADWSVLFAAAGTLAFLIIRWFT